MNKAQKHFRSVWAAVLLLACLLCANAAKADSIVDLTISVPDSGASGLVVSDGLDDWFFNPDPPAPFPAELNPSDLWTSAANIATLDYWLSLVLELGEENDPSDLISLYGSGTVSSPDPSTAVVPISQISPANTQTPVSQTSSEDLVSSVPEPVTMWLFAGGVALLAMRRTRVAIIDHGPL